jgi:hypothetical protein
MVMDLLTMVVIGFNEAVLQEVVVVVLQEVGIMAFSEMAIATPERPKPTTICYKTNKAMDRAYLESIVPFMVSYLTPYNTKSFIK